MKSKWKGQKKSFGGESTQLQGPRQFQRIRFHQTGTHKFLQHQSRFTVVTLGSQTSDHLARMRGSEC